MVSRLNSENTHTNKRKLAWKFPHASDSVGAEPQRRAEVRRTSSGGGMKSFRFLMQRQVRLQEGDAHGTSPAIKSHRAKIAFYFIDGRKYRKSYHSGCMQSTKWTTVWVNVPALNRCPSTSTRIQEQIVSASSPRGGVHHSNYVLNCGMIVGHPTETRDRDRGQETNCKSAEVFLFQTCYKCMENGGNELEERFIIWRRRRREAFSPASVGWAWTQQTFQSL